MVISFICGSLEPGLDGVGDYTRRFASELIRLGNQVALISINDHYIELLFSGTQFSEGFDIPVERVPSSLPEIERFYFLEKFIAKFDPEWISLQFVPFAFNSKGLPFTLADRLVKIGKGRRWHIMFHELWVGMNKEASVKHFFWGCVQRRLIVILIKKLKPVIHTQSQLYLEQLKQLGFQANYLPLFSNIPLVKLDLKEGQINNNSELVKNVSFVLFAAIHTGAPVDLFARDIALYSRSKGQKVSLIIIGRSSSEKERWAAAWEAEGLIVKIMGEQSVDCISAILSSASAGITTTPFALVEKSGAVAAMQEHGLPVVCVSYKWTARGINRFNLPNDIIEYPLWNIDSFLSSKQSIEAKQNIKEIANLFVMELA